LNRLTVTLAATVHNKQTAQ